MLDVGTIRQDFPILSERVNGRQLVYLDNAATTQKPRQVINAIVRYYEHENANIHRGIHTLAVRATDRYEATRDRVARFIGASSREEVIFTRNTTESINLVAYAWGDANIREGDEIVLSVTEHHSNIVPWQMLARRKGAVLHYVDITEDGTLEMDRFRQLIGPRTKLVALVHVSNVLGTVNPVSDVAEIAHRSGALMLVDGAQSASHMPVDMASLGCDFFAFSAHKMLGPTGVGVLWGRAEILEAMEPFLGGGSMISAVWPHESTWAELPQRFEAGTPNIADVVAFDAAIRYLESHGMRAVYDHELELTAYALDRMAGIPGLRLHGPMDAYRRAGIVSFTMEGAHPHDVSTILDAYGVAIRAGHHCAQPLMRRLQVPATNRASFALYNQRDEIDAMVEALDTVRSVFAHDGSRATV